MQIPNHGDDAGNSFESSEIQNGWARTTDHTRASSQVTVKKSYDRRRYAATISASNQIDGVDWTGARRITQNIRWLWRVVQIADEGCCPGPGKDGRTCRTVHDVEITSSSAAFFLGRQRIQDQEHKAACQLPPLIVLPPSDGQ
jgi:hypothetical protein